MIVGLTLAERAAAFAYQKKAEDITILDLREISTITDYFVICSGTSTPHLKAIRREIKEQLKYEHDVIPTGADGEPNSQWMILDYGDVIVHIFHDSRRSRFSLEELWGDAPVIDFDAAAELAAVSMAS